MIPKGEALDPETLCLAAQKRLESTEMRQNQMMGFLSTALQNPSMLQQLVGSRQGIQRLENGPRTRAPASTPEPHCQTPSCQRLKALGRSLCPPPLRLLELELRVC